MQLNMYTLYIVRTINADQVSILDIINMIVDVNIDSCFNLLNVPWSCSSGRACPQFASTSGLHVSSSNHGAASSQKTAEPGAQTDEGEVKTYNPTDRCTEKETHLLREFMWDMLLVGNCHNHYVLCTVQSRHFSNPTGKRWTVITCFFKILSITFKLSSSCLIILHGYTVHPKIKEITNIQEGKFMENYFLCFPRHGFQYSFHYFT